MEDTAVKLIVNQIGTLQTSMVTQFAGVNDRLDKINGRVGRTEDEIKIIMVEKERIKDRQDTGLKQVDELWVKVEKLSDADTKHFLQCPITPQLNVVNEKIRKLEDNNLVTFTKSGFLKSSIALIAVLISITVGILKITETSANKTSERLIGQNDTIIENQSALYNQIRNNTIKINEIQRSDSLKLKTK